MIRYKMNSESNKAGKRYYVILLLAAVIIALVKSQSAGTAVKVTDEQIILKTQNTQSVINISEIIEIEKISHDEAAEIPDMKNGFVDVSIPECIRIRTQSREYVFNYGNLSSTESLYQALSELIL